MLEGYTSFKDYYVDLSNATTSVDFSKLLGITENSHELMVIIAGSLATYREDVLNFETKHSFYTPVKGDVNLKVVCSKAVGAPFSSKRQFYTYVDENFKEKVNITWSNSATKSCDLLIWSGADGTDSITSKVEKVCKFNRQGLHIPILTAQQFLDILNLCSDGFVLKDTLEGLDIIDYVDYI